MGLPAQWGIDGVPFQDHRWILAQRIAGSSQLQKAPQLREILLYIAAHTLTEGPVAISEQKIGTVVLGRGRDFDPNLDNIVRVRIRHLRAKLEEYFNSEGNSEPVVLSIPKGCYIARFEPRCAAAAEEKEAGRVSFAAAWCWLRGLKRILRIGVVAASVVVVVATFLFWKDSALRRGSAASAPPPVHADYAFYQDVLGPLARNSSSEAQIIISNPRVMLYVGSESAPNGATVDHGLIPVPPELERKLAPAANRPAQGAPHHVIQITDKDYTGIGEATSCYYLGQLMQMLGRRPRITQSRFLNWDSARRENLIILGSPDINQWADQNVPTGNYSLGQRGVRNEKPRPGEPDLYQVVRDAQTRTPLVDYGLIWMSRSASGSRLLVLAGCTSPGTAGVGSFFPDPDKMRPVYQKLKAAAPGNEFPSDWQVLLKVSIRDKIPIETTYVAHRILAPAQ